MAKQILYGEEARKALLTGIDKLSNTVKSPLVPRDAMWFLIRNTVHPYHQRRRYNSQGNRA